MAAPPAFSRTGGSKSAARPRAGLTPSKRAESKSRFIKRSSAGEKETVLHDPPIPPARVYRSATSEHKATTTILFLGDPGIAGRRRRVIFPRGRAKHFREDRLQFIGPDLITFQAQVQPIRRHTLQELTVSIR